MILISASIPFGYEPNISIFGQMRRGRQSYLKRSRCPYCPTSPRQLIRSRRCLIRTKMRTSIQHDLDPKAKLSPWRAVVGVILCLTRVTLLAASLSSIIPTFPEIFLIMWLTFFLKFLWRHYFLNKNLNISGTRKDFSETKTPSFVTLKGLWNKHIFFFFFYFIGTLKIVSDFKKPSQSLNYWRTSCLDVWGSRECECLGNKGVVLALHLCLC